MHHLRIFIGRFEPNDRILPPKMTFALHRTVWGRMLIQTNNDSTACKFMLKASVYLFMEY